MLLWTLLFASFFCFSLASRFAPGSKHKRFAGSVAASIEPRRKWSRRAASAAAAAKIVTPKFFIISLFSEEADIWYQNMPQLFQQNITVPGASPLFPDAHCIANGDVCQITLGAGEINAASSMSALLYSGLFNLEDTYTVVFGVSGINPHMATTGSVIFPRYAVQFDLQYEFDSRQIESNYSSGYFPQFSDFPDSRKGFDYPGVIYGTEAFELNENLRQRFMKLARTNPLSDSASARKYRKTYGFAPANQPPSVVGCASGTSNVYWSGNLLGQAFSAYTRLLTNGTGVYCATQQEDNAILEVLMRGDLAGKVDFARTAILRTASDFDRAPPGETETYHLLYANQNGFEISIENLFVAGHPIVMDVVKKWESTYKKGIKATNYIGDLFNSLGNSNPDIGTESIYIN